MLCKVTPNFVFQAEQLLSGLWNLAKAIHLLSMLKVLAARELKFILSLDVFSPIYNFLWFSHQCYRHLGFSEIPF